ncbi:MAG: hypothetical protein NVS3B25_33310 [Hymenobacter sp.]
MTHPLDSWRRWALLSLLGAGALWATLQWWRQRPAGSGGRAAAGPTLPAARAHSPPAPFDSTRLRGVSWVGGDSSGATELVPLLHDHVTWLSQTPFGWQDGLATPEIRVSTAAGRHRGYWGESDAGLVATARLGRQHRLKTLLKPHLWVRGSASGWAGDIEMTRPADWAAWFASYSAFMLHYARLAEAAHMEMLCVGTELVQTTGRAHEAAWRDVIRQVRQVYHGPLTYAANYDEYQQIPFWDALDYIGIQAYFPLSTQASPSLATLVAGWQPHLKALAQLQKKVGKPVIFTEIGYKTTADAANEPWKWPTRAETLPPADGDTQARCYEAMFRACWGLPWLKGMFIWKWYPGLTADGSARRHADFTPQHKPAEAVLARWYGQ